MRREGGDAVDVKGSLPGKLLSQCSVRRQEHEQITAARYAARGRPARCQMEQVRDALSTPITRSMVMVGPFGSKVEHHQRAARRGDPDVGPIPTTDHIAILRRGADLQRTRAGDVETVFHPSPLLEHLSLVDTPGLESVFRTHDEVTGRFLHRADVVLLVMIATQVLSASNLEYLQALKAYGKRVIVVVNQVDLLDEAEREQVRDFVLEQSRLHLGMDSLVWLVSAQDALSPRNRSSRARSVGRFRLRGIEAYIRETLGDIERLRQKAGDAVQICQNVTKTRQGAGAAGRARHAPQTLDNIEARDRAGPPRNSARRWTTAWPDRSRLGRSRRASGAIGEMFQFSRGSGCSSAGWARSSDWELVRRFSGRTRARSAFERHRCAETFQRVPELKPDKLGAPGRARLAGHRRSGGLHARRGAKLRSTCPTRLSARCRRRCATSATSCAICAPAPGRPAARGAAL